MPRKLAPVHPGEVLREEFMGPLSLTMNRLALDLRVPVTRIAEIYHERRGITPDTALRLGQYFRNSPDFWLNLQMRYDLDVAQDRSFARVVREVQPRAATTSGQRTRAGRG
jgi:addiction module HigA family antidote